MTWDLVGDPVTGGSTSTVSLDVSPTAIGNIAVVGVGAVPGVGTSISGGGVTDWVSLFSTSNAQGGTVVVYAGVITSTGDTTCDVGVGFDDGGNAIYQEVEPPAGSVGFALDNNDTQNFHDVSSPDSGNFPSLGPSVSDCLYIAVMQTGGGGDMGGDTDGFTYTAFASEGGDLFVLGPSISDAVSPDWTCPEGVEWASQAWGFISADAPPDNMMVAFYFDVLP